MRGEQGNADSHIVSIEQMRRTQQTFTGSTFEPTNRAGACTLVATAYIALRAMRSDERETSA